MALSNEAEETGSWRQVLLSWHDVLHSCGHSRYHQLILALSFRAQTEHVTILSVIQ